MSEHQSVPEEESLGRMVVVRAIGVDDFSDVRYLHATSFKTLAASSLSEQEVESFVTSVYSPGYVDELQDTNLLGAFSDGHLVGTAAWSAGDDSGETARLSSVFVNPMFSGHGIGRRLVREAERRAAEAGYARIAVQATANATGFFRELGYVIASYGVGASTRDAGVIPVTFMRRTLSDRAP